MKMLRIRDLTNPTPRYDVIVIGARCAGSPTAMLLARKGYRVLLVDKSTFPSDIMSGHYIHQPGVAQLKRWGLLEKVVASNCPLIVKGTFDVGPFALTGSPPPADGVAEAYAPRRTLLDKILVDAAVEAGVELRERFAVQEIIMDNNCVTGIRGRASSGPTVTEKARIVIGADGMRSIVARTVQAPEYHRKPSLSCGYYSYWSGIPIDGFELYLRKGRVMAAFPTNDRLVLIFAGWPNKQFREFRADIQGNFLNTLDLAPWLAERVRNGRREERFVGTADVPNFFRKPYGPGWALLGDAGYHKDPATGQGITDAFCDAELLAEAVDNGFSERQPLEEALAGYERKRNQERMPMYEFTCQFASLEPPAPEQMQLWAALHGNQAETNRFLGTIAGTVPIPEFQSPGNIQRIIERAQPGDSATMFAA
jgi:flavin-dependent dehydrogenase